MAATAGFVLDISGVLNVPENPPLPDKPSIAVLPFDNMSGDPEQEYFSDGITEDLITDLSRSPQLFVIARSSTFTYKGKPVNVEQIGRELGVRYVVEGSVRRQADRIRVTAQLVDATTGFHLWSERYDREMKDVFALQSQLSEQIMAAIGVEIQDAELARIRHKPTESLDAHDAYLKGVYHFTRFTREEFKEARKLLQRAIEIDPKFALPYATLGVSYYLEYLQCWNVDPRLLESAMQLGRQALGLDPRNPQALNLVGAVYALQGRWPEAKLFAEKAVEADPNWNVAQFVLGLHRVREGDLLGAIRSADRSLRLNPKAPSSELAGIGIVNWLVGRTDKAAELWERARAENADLIMPRIGLIAVYGSQDRYDEARELVREIRRVNAELTTEHVIHLLPWRLIGGKKAELEKHLRTAGLP
ncbi:MAG: tetratricopeptide repeat protein [Acidobacteriota bacterium]